MKLIGYIDTETVSDFDIKAAGTIRYAEKCDLLCITWILPGQSQCWLWEAHHGEMPTDLRAALLDERITWVAHNAMFDRTALVSNLGPEFAHLADPRRWVCTAALARYFGLPGKLGDACRRVGLPEKFSKFDDSGGIDYFTKRYSRNYRKPTEDPERWARFMHYAVQDTVACRALHKKLGLLMPGKAKEHWAGHERRVFEWDQRVNEKGMKVDPQVLDSALGMIHTVQPILEREMSNLTNGEVTKLGSPKLKAYLGSEFMMDIPNLRKETLDDLLEEGIEELDPKAEAIIRLRRFGQKTSTAKYGRMDSMMSDDGRVRAGFLYHGAHTGRWSGQGFQPQNLTRPVDDLDPVQVADAIVACGGDHEALALLYDQHIMEVLASGIRGAIVPAPGNVLVIADYNQIESRLTAFYSGCQRKLDAFWDHDTGQSDLDPYEVTALDVLGDSERRQEGKMMDLGLGFGMGSVKFAMVSKLDWLRARDLVEGWRQTYPEVPALWRGIGSMFSATLGQRVKLSHLSRKVVRRLDDLGVSVTRDRNKLGTFTLPNGKPLHYHTLRAVTHAEEMRNAAKYGRLGEALRKFREFTQRDYDPEADGPRIKHGALAYQGHYGNQRLVHGGFLTENFVQGSAREVMAEHVLDLEEEHGLVPVLHAHDEPVFEVPEAEAEWVAGLVKDAMERVPKWLEGMPLKAEVRISTRYTK